MTHAPKTKWSKLTALALALVLALAALVGCSAPAATTSPTSAAPSAGPTVEVTTAAAESATPEATAAESAAPEGKYNAKDATAETVVKDAAAKGKVGNWGLGTSMRSRRCSPSTASPRPI